MFLRMLLLGLVAGLGLDGSESNGLERRLAEGRAWWQSQLETAAGADQAEAPVVAQELLALVPERDHAAIVVVEEEVDRLATTPSTPDAAFTALVTDQVLDFASAPVVTVSPDELVAATLPALTASETDWAADEIFPGLEVTTPEVPLPSFAATLAVSEMAFGPEMPLEPVATPVAEAEVAVVASPTPALTPEPQDPARTEQLDTAMRLTGEAVQAWLTVFHARVDHDAPRVATGPTGLTE